MNKVRSQGFKLFLFCLLLGNNGSWAEKNAQKEETKVSTSTQTQPVAQNSPPSLSNTSEDKLKDKLISEIPSLNAQQVNWTFSGIVSNENGEYYSYFFQVKRQGKAYNVLATLINDETKKVIFLEEIQATIENSENNYWRIGNAFLRFNSINNSWIFGVRGKNKAGFNFKVDMLSRASETTRKKPSELRPGVNFLINQTGNLNGHIQLGEGRESKGKEELSEQFVRAHTTWFRQIWITKAQNSLHPFQGILCQFKEGNGFYSLNLREEDALIGAIAGWRNTEGKPVKMSQFVAADKMKSGEWCINVSTPKIKLFFENALVNEDKEHLIMGSLQDKPGFCVINKEEIG